MPVQSTNVHLGLDLQSLTFGEASESRIAGYSQDVGT